MEEVPAPKVRATVLLCDAAQEIGGKLYILGGGWSRVIRLAPNINMALAVKLRIPWHDANRRLTVEIALLTEDHKPVMAPNDQAISVAGGVEVGRPPGLRPGSDLDSAFAVPLVLSLEPGAYVWEVSIEGERIEELPFEVLPPPPGFVLTGGPSPPEG